MNKITEGLEGCVTYIDDVIIYSDTWEEQLHRLEALLQKLACANLVAHLSKCEFVRATVQYLGFIVGFGEVAPSTAKIEAICQFPSPKTKRKLQRYLGMVGYYRKMILNFSDIVSPLTELLKEGLKYEWSQNCEIAFGKVKAILTQRPIFRTPDFNKPFMLAVDASNVGAGSVLLQEHKGINFPVCYYSKKLSSAQCNYSTIEKELLSLILALKHFSVYINGPIVVYKHHHPLKFLDKFWNKNHRLTRWSLILQEYDLEIWHVKGETNVIADCLSRLYND